MEEKLIQNLFAFGLSEYEARVYLTLAIKGPLTASEISKLARIPYSKVYEVIKNLKIKTMVEVSLEKNQRKFKVVEPMQAIKKMIKKREEEVRELKNKAKEIFKQIKKQRIDYKPQGGIWISEGKREFLEKVSIMGRNSKNYAYAITKEFSRITELDYEIINAAKRGVKVKMLGIGKFNKLNLARAEWYASHNVEIRMIELGVQPRVCLIDGKEVCIRIDNPNDSEFIWSDNQALVNFVKSYFEVLWKNAKEFKPNKKIL
jgi:sugar-specific transcriptional regulator TrmB